MGYGRLENPLERSDKGFLPWTNFSTPELVTFCRRGISIARVSWDADAYRARLIDRLEHADDWPKFKRFLDLPPELRNAVYEMALADHAITSDADEPLPIDPLGCKGCPNRRSWAEARKSVNLLQTCSQIRNEVLPLFYANSAFVLDLIREYHLGRSAPYLQTIKAQVQRLETWAGRIAIHNLKHIRTLVLAVANNGCKHRGRRSVMKIRIEFSKGGVDVQHEGGAEGQWWGCLHCAEDRLAVKRIEAVCKKMLKSSNSNGGVPKLNGKLLVALLNICCKTKW